jgi:hypothetical protein
LAVVDCFLALERSVATRPGIVLVRVFLEYRRRPGTDIRETADFVSEEAVSANRIVPDGAFIIENRETLRRGLFFLEMDRGTERIIAPKSVDLRATVRGKFVQYDRYLLSGRFARTYQAFGQFGFATVLIVALSPERIENIRQAASDLPDTLHPYYRLYYRLSHFPAVTADFLGPVWKSRSAADPRIYALVTGSA